MSLRNEVSRFLSNFKVHLETWDVLYLDREKNAQALLDLEIVPLDRTKILKGLKVEDYSEGPKEEKIFGKVQLWVFGKTVKSQEVYIKISLGNHGPKVICISFHVAEKPMEYPLKLKE